MKAWAIIIGFLLVSTPAAAFVPCRPMDGLSIDQWFNACEPALREDYSEGYGRGQDWDGYVRSAYATYAQSAPPMGGGMPHGGMLCAPGMRQCFNHWVRSCQLMPTGGSWWVTSANRC